MRNWLVLVILMLSCSSLHAQPGFYVGAEGGGHICEAMQSGHVTGGDFGTIFYATDIISDLFKRNFAGMLFAGYGLQYRRCYLGVEGVLQFTGAKLNSLQQSNVATIAGDQIFDLSINATSKVRYPQWGLDFLPGFFLDPEALLYVRVGVGATTVKSTLANTNTAKPSGASPTVFLNQELSKKRTFCTLRAGLGVELQLTNHLSLRTDYIYSRIGKLSLAGNAASGTVILSTTDQFHYYDHAALLGLSYRFGCCPGSCCPKFSDGCVYDGAYFGAAAGGSVLDAHSNGNIEGNPGIFSDNLFANDPSFFFENSFRSSEFIGWGRTWRRLYYGGEVFVSAAKNTIRWNLDTVFSETVGPILDELVATTELRVSQFQLGFDFRPGVLLTKNTMLNARIGVCGVKMGAHTSSFAIVRNVSTFRVDVEDVSKSKKKAALRLGIGFEHALSRHLHLRGDYTYTNYGKITLLDTVGSGSSFITSSLSSQLRDNAVLIGLSYYFR